jgi:quinoprotein glucose dehydrogenase
MRIISWILVCFFIFCHLSCKDLDTSISSKHPEDYSGWKTYAGTKDGMRYSSNAQINLDNVHELQIAWRYKTHDRDTNNRSQNQCNPIVVDGILYGISPRLKLFALDAATGNQKWLFDPASEEESIPGRSLSFNVSRGVVYWEDEKIKDKRIFYGVGKKIYCVNANDGTLVRSFGENGAIDLSIDLDRDPSEYNPSVASTTPGIIYKDLLITGTRVTESADAAPGHIRAYDVRDGKRRWIFHTIPHPGETGYDTWPDKDAWKRLGGANNWAGMSLDEKRGIVYVPTGSVSGDFYGGIRKGKNLFANSLIALEAATGKYLWHYQVVHHDLWDRDLPANPNLVTLHKDGKRIDAVAQITKHGYVFLFDRVNGKPIFQIEERPVPQNALPGEEPWPTQPFPTLPEPFARQKFTIDDVTDISPEAHQEMLEKFKQIKYSEMFTPPSKEGAWIFPGFDGGGQWGGASVDPESQILYVNSSELPWSMTMIEIPKRNDALAASGRSIYDKYCIACHGPDMKGIGESFPSLVALESKYSEEHIRQIIDNGMNMMPSFRIIPEDEKKSLIAFLMNMEEKELGGSQKMGEASQHREQNEVRETSTRRSILDEIPYAMTGYRRFLDKDGYPGITPPWGTLNAVDLNSGKLLWKVPLGEYPELTARGIPPTGTENYGGPVVTKGGLVFIAATKDAKIRAFDKKTGKVLWEAELPVPGYATPAVYAINGRQYVVIACGGGKIGSKSGDEYIAFALPE